MPSLHVLVIDDEPAARQVLAAAVSKAGYSVDAAADVAEATAAALPALLLACRPILERVEGGEPGAPAR